MHFGTEDNRSGAEHKQGSAHGFELICSTIKLRNGAREEIGMHWRHKIDPKIGRHGFSQAHIKSGWSHSSQEAF